MNNRIKTLLHSLEHHHPLPAVELKLERMREFLHRIGNPQRNIPPVIHVAGTNGKGSVLAFLHAIMIAAGKTAHRYTSPHLVTFNERYILANHQISDEVLIEALESLVSELQSHPLTYFEAATVLAFRLFEQHTADYTLLEVGMGGRLDATNVIDNPIATIIMPISLDHQDFLGNTIEKIAYEKACIMKANAPCIIGHQPPEALQIMQEYAAQVNAPTYSMGQDWEYSISKDGSLHYHSDTLSFTTPSPALIGLHQYGNAATAVACADLLGLATSDAMQQGVSTAQWAGRLQRITTPLTHHTVYLDGGHNPAAALMLNDWIKSQSHNVHVVFGMHNDKDVSETLQLLGQHAASLNCVAAQDDPKAMEATQLVAIAHNIGLSAIAHDSLTSALTFLTVTNPQHGIILVTGSLYLVGEALATCLK